MAYEEDLANRVREVIGGERGLSEKRMFGGLAMLLHGNMAVVVRGRGGLMVRVEPEEYDELLEEPGAEEMHMRGKAMRGWITVAPSAFDKDADLRRWVDRGMAYARTLPRK